MAEAKRMYGQDAVYGSLAYDRDHPELYADEPAAAPREEARPRAGAHAAPRHRQGIAPFSIVGVLVAAFLFVTAMTARTRLLDLSSEKTRLESEIALLEAERTRLRISHESAFDLTQVQAYAEGVLGMRAPDEGQIEYIDTSSPDRAEVIRGGEEGTFVDRISDFLTELRSYFPLAGE